jgi:hypothetical protein
MKTAAESTKPDFTLRELYLPLRLEGSCCYSCRRCGSGGNEGRRDDGSGGRYSDGRRALLDVKVHTRDGLAEMTGQCVVCDMEINIWADVGRAQVRGR